MRRIGSVWDEIVSFQNLLRAAERAAAGKRTTKGVATFLARREPELLALQRELIAGTWRPGTPTTFTIRDPRSEGARDHRSTIPRPRRAPRADRRA